jgi:hypothetical protein
VLIQLSNHFELSFKTEREELKKLEEEEIWISMILFSPINLGKTLSQITHQVDYLCLKLKPFYYIKYKIKKMIKERSRKCYKKKKSSDIQMKFILEFKNTIYLGIVNREISP